MSDDSFVNNRKVAGLLSRKDKIRYAIHAARLVIDTYEERNPSDNRPRLAIEAAEKVLESDTEETRAAAKEAYFGAYLAYESAVYAGKAAESASQAASCAYLDFDASFSAARACHAASFIRLGITEDCVEYGMSLLEPRE